MTTFGLSVANRAIRACQGPSHPVPEYPGSLLSVPSRHICALVLITHFRGDKSGGGLSTIRGWFINPTDSVGRERESVRDAGVADHPDHGKANLPVRRVPRSGKPLDTAVRGVTDRDELAVSFDALEDPRGELTVVVAIESHPLLGALVRPDALGSGGPQSGRARQLGLGEFLQVLAVVEQVAREVGREVPDYVLGRLIDGLSSTDAIAGNRLRGGVSIVFSVGAVVDVRVEYRLE